MAHCEYHSFPFLYPVYPESQAIMISTPIYIFSKFASNVLIKFNSNSPLYKRPSLIHMRLLECQHLCYCDLQHCPAPPCQTCCLFLYCSGFLGLLCFFTPGVFHFIETLTMHLKLCYSLQSLLMCL